VFGGLESREPGHRSEPWSKADDGTYPQCMLLNLPYPTKE
jgi:hypothetical protein